MPETVKQVAARVSETLGSHGIPEGFLEAEVLLRHALGYDRARFYASLHDAIDEESLRRVEVLADRRIAREPLAYIVGRREFYGLELSVSPAVLIPRQETELLVDIALEFARQRSNERILVADIGTGSGAIAVALAVNFPNARVYATDCSTSALAVAERNRHKHGVADRVCLLQGDLLAPLPHSVDMIVSNPPYIASRRLRKLPPEVRREPQLALDGGEGGLEVMRRLLQQAPTKLNANGCLILEISPEQAEAVREMALKRFPKADITHRNDLLRLARCVIVSTKQ